MLSGLVRSLAGAALATLVATAALRAQVIETPVPFDSAGRVLELTPASAARLGLAPPHFDVQGAFTRARLYASSAGGHVLVVERPNGVIERYQLDGAATTALRGGVTAATASGRIPGETDLPSQPAARQFIRNQVILAALLYGPNLAALANDGKTATVLYLLGAPTAYFTIATATRGRSITRAQNRLATDGAVRGYFAVNAALTALAGDVPDRKTIAGVGLAGAIGGTLGGLAYGRGLTDSEAKAATTTSSFTALTALGVLGALGIPDGASAERIVAGATVAAGTAGYLLGHRYPRSASYRVTVGDINMLWIGATLATAAVSVPLVDSRVDPKLGFGIATAGMLAGIVASDRFWARPYDHSASDVTMMWLGTIAGGLVGAAAVVLTEPSDAAPVLGLVTAGAAAGALVTHRMLSVAPAGTRTARLGGAEVEISGASLAFAAAGVRGVHPLLRVRF